MQILMEFRTRIRDVETLINKIRNKVDRGVSRKHRERAIHEVSQCITTLAKKDAH